LVFHVKAKQIGYYKHQPHLEFLNYKCYSKIVKVSADKKISSYDLKDSVTLVSWLPLIIAAPFRDSPQAIEQQVFDNILNTLLLKMDDDGFIAK